MTQGHNIYPSVGMGSIKEWLCYKCPNVVKQFSNKVDSFVIMTRLKDSWYEIEQMYTSPDSKEPPLLSISKYFFIKEGEKLFTKLEFVLELNVDGRITPENIKDKLATILTFS